MEIREFDAERDQDFLRACILELQETERACDPRLPSGPEMVERYCGLLLERSKAWRGAVFIAEERQRPLGLVSLFLEVPETEPDEPPGSYVLITDLVVARGERGRGVGRALLEHAEAYARKAGKAVLRLEVMAKNLGARNFYARYGWEERLIQMEKDLGRG